MLDLRGDGRIMLYKREGLKNPKWQVRVRVPNATEYLIRTTKTADLEEAKRFALNLYESTYMHVAAGGQVKRTTFQQVFDEWSKTARAEAVARIKQYALGHFGKLLIDELKEKHIAEYYEKRLSGEYMQRKKSGITTIMRERVFLRQVLTYARSRGYILTVPDTNPARIKSKVVRRPTWNAEEWKQLYTAARSWVKEAEGMPWWRDRFILQNYLLFMGSSGLRVGEARVLKWKDIRTTKDGHTILTVKGKTGSREVVIQKGADRYLKRINSINKAGHELVFCHEDGKKIGTLNNSLKALMKYAGVPIVKDGMARTCYSMRHFYITTRLQNGVDVFLLAKNAGTSVQMITQFYSHIIHTELADRLTKLS